MKIKTANRILAGLCTAEAVFLGSLCFVFYSRTDAPPADIFPEPIIPTYSEPLGKTVWSAEKESFLSNSQYITFEKKARKAGTNMVK